MLRWRLAPLKRGASKGSAEASDTGGKRSTRPPTHTKHWARSCRAMAWPTLCSAVRKARRA
eukprot:10206051-Lingulodinium_polyedra.AAC.1